MIRLFTIAAILALTITTAQAGSNDTLAARIHEAASEACSVERAPVFGPQAYYGAIYERCVARLSDVAMRKYLAQAEARAARAKLAGN